jgi:hypothetical protein
VAAAAIGFAVATGTLVVPDAAQAAPTSSTATSEGAKRLNTRAQELFNAGNISGAADTYAEIFDELPENHVNREERDNNVLVTLEAYREAYELRRSSPGDKSLEEAVELLRRAVRVFDRYEAEYRRVYGGQSISPEATASGRQIKDLLAAAEKDLAPTPPPEAAKPAEPTPFISDGYEPPVGPNGTGLIVAGSVMLAAGLGTTAMIIVGARMTKQANRDKADAMTDEQADDVDRRGTTGNALIITGSILTAAFVISGATMLGIGIHRRQRYMAFEPAVGRGYAGLSLRGRF